LGDSEAVRARMVPCARSSIQGESQRSASRAFGGNAGFEFGLGSVVVPFDALRVVEGVEDQDGGSVRIVAGRAESVKSLKKEASGLTKFAEASFRSTTGAAAAAADASLFRNFAVRRVRSARVVVRPARWASANLGDADG
jgi:hypothetical protein